MSQEKVDDVFVRIKKMLKHVMICAEKKFDKRLGFFELLGCDIMIDADLKPYLIEVNTNPALFLDTKVQADVLPTIIKSVDKSFIDLL